MVMTHNYIELYKDRRVSLHDIEDSNHGVKYNLIIKKGSVTRVENTSCSEIDKCVRVRGNNI